MKKVNNVTVVIRSCGERTLELCKQIILKQVPEENIFVINEAPFSKAVEKTFLIGIEQQKEYTLAVDADILLLPDTVHTMIKKHHNIGSSFFLYQGLVLDKIYGQMRGGGPHLYRSHHLKTALKLLAEEPENIRPESVIYKKMAGIGYHFFQDNTPYGLHDFLQFHYDYYRKCYIHAKKHSSISNMLFQHWLQNIMSDDIYKSMILGYIEGALDKQRVHIDINYFEKKKYSENNGLLWY